MRASDTVVIVLGYHDFSAGAHDLSNICRAGVRRAADLAEEIQPRAVIFTGWASGDGPSEADQMAALWSGPAETTVIREPAAINTAENATRSLAILEGLRGVQKAVVVCSIRHVLRVRFLFRPLFASYGITVKLAPVCVPPPSPRIWLAELGGITRMTGDRRKAIEALQRGDHQPFDDSVAPVRNSE